MKKGFTLLEMIVVLAILSVLFLLAIPNIQKVLNLVETKGCQAQVKVVDTAIIQFKLIYNEYPSNINDLVYAELLSDNQVKCQNNQSITIKNGQANAE